MRDTWDPDADVPSVIKYSNPHLSAVMGVELCPPFLSSSLAATLTHPSLRLSLSHEALAALHFYTH